MVSRIRFTSRDPDGHRLEDHDLRRDITECGRSLPFCDGFSGRLVRKWQMPRGCALRKNARLVRRRGRSNFCISCRCRRGRARCAQLSASRDAPVRVRASTSPSPSLAVAADRRRRCARAAVRAAGRCRRRGGALLPHEKLRQGGKKRLEGLQVRGAAEEVVQHFVLNVRHQTRQTFRRLPSCIR